MQQEILVTMMVLRHWVYSLKKLRQISSWMLWKVDLVRQSMLTRKFHTLLHRQNSHLLDRGPVRVFSRVEVKINFMAVKSLIQKACKLMETVLVSCKTTWIMTKHFMTNLKTRTNLIKALTTNLSFKTVVLGKILDRAVSFRDAIQEWN